MAYYRDYPDKAALDAEFTLDHVPDLAGAFARRIERSRAARKRWGAKVGIPYGDGPSETLDLYFADASAPGPVQVFFHGGFWRSLDAATFGFVADGFAPFGATVAVIDYALIPQVDLATIVDQCRRAVAWLWRNVGRHGGDPARIFLSGHSAGAHLVACLMDRAWPSAFGLPADVVKGGLGASGVYDLDAMRLSAQNETLGFTAEEVAAFSPIHNLPRTAGELILTVGGMESREFIAQTEVYGAAWRAAGLAGSAGVIADTDHIRIILDHLAAPEAALNRAVRAQMGIA